MTKLKRDMTRIQELVGRAYTRTGSLVALSDGGQMSPEKLQKTLEQIAGEFEASALELRTLCEQYTPGVGGYGAKPSCPWQSVVGHVEVTPLGWLHIRLNTLLPHCRFSPPAWLTETIRTLLDDFSAGGHHLPRFDRAMLIMEEHSSIRGRHVFDQDNKGWKAVSNALKGRVIPDDDQYTLAVSLLSVESEANICHITLLDLADAADYFAWPNPYGTPSGEDQK